MRLFLLLIICTSLFRTLPAQRAIKTQGTAQLELTHDKSRDQVKAEVLDLALINAIEQAFGRVVIQGNATYINNLNTGEKVESQSIFHVIANTWVKGEVEKVLEVNYSDVKGSKTVGGHREEMLAIQCDVLIQARELQEPPMRFTAKTLACPKPACATVRFRTNDDLFLQFSSPQSGYLTVYLDDGANASRLLPYREMPASCERGFPIKADQEYIFFSNAPEHNYLEFEWNEDCYQLYAETAQDLNRMFVIFSVEPLSKPRLKTRESAELLNREEQEAGYSLPHYLPSEDFQRWLHTVRSYSGNLMQLMVIDVTISR